MGHSAVEIVLPEVLTRLGGFGARAAGSANGAQHDSLGFEPQENVTTHLRERQRRVPSGAIWMEMTGVGNIGVPR